MGGGGNTPNLPATPAPTPIPSQPTSTAPVQTEGQRQKKISNLKKGMMSTIKTSPAGVSGTGSDLDNRNAAGNRTLGGA
jgi:hypothetical protein